MKRRRRFLTGFFLAGFLALTVLAYFVSLIATPYGGERQVLVEIKPGTPTRAIAVQLREAGVIRSELAFVAWARLRYPRKLKAGEYSFDRPLTIREVLGKLARGEVYYHAVTIPEGYNLFDAANAMGASGLTTRDQALAALQNPHLIADLDPQAGSLEGFIFPDTYLFTRPADARHMAAAMVARFRHVYRELAARYPSAGAVHDVVTMASLVEKETGVAPERPLVAGVFYNRLNKGMRLQCDPTVIYAAMLAGRYTGAIRQSDLAFDSPYNTYIRAGLPPGPIANPGRASLEAAMAPAPSNYLYFVAGGQNGHRFSATLNEHARNVAAYRNSR